MEWKKITRSSEFRIELGGWRIFFQIKALSFVCCDSWGWIICYSALANPGYSLNISANLECCLNNILKIQAKNVLFICLKWFNQTGNRKTIM